MKTKLFTLLAALLLVASCGGGYNPPEPNPGNPNPNGGGNNTSTNTNTQPPMSNFVYTKSHPFYVKFSNASMNATSYEWNFGDGKTSTESSPVHQYESKGVYKVSLIAKGNGKSNTYTETIKLEEPTVCYVDKIEFNIIPKNNEYYKIECTDDYLFIKDLYWATNWILLSSANLPYTYNINKKIDFSKDEYVFRLFQNSSKSGNGKEIGAWVVKPSGIKKYFHEDMRASNNDMTQTFTIYYRWED